MAGQKDGIEFDSRDFLAGLERAVKDVRLETEGDLLRFAVRVQNKARRLCPVDTGRLRSSITTSGLERDGRGAFVTIGTNVQYAPYVEFGTRFQRPQPFLRPALLDAARAGLR